MTDVRPPEPPGPPPPPGPTTEERPPATGAALADALSLPDDWPSRAADSVELAVALVHDKAVRPVLIAVRSVVFGLFLAALVTAIVTWGSVMLFRLMDVYFWPGEVWISYLLVGGILTLAGLACFTQRVQRGPARNRS
jgi:hypothetical protein